MEKRLALARGALEAAWKLDPHGSITPRLMLAVLLGVGCERDEMESWFGRAMVDEGSRFDAVSAKMEWLDPKWYGTPEDVLAFGRSCRESKDWRSGITLFAVQAHQRVIFQYDDERREEYTRNDAFWEVVRAVYEEYLSHYEGDDRERSMFAALCYECHKYKEADREFKAVGANLSGNYYFDMEEMTERRDAAAEMMKLPAPR